MLVFRQFGVYGNCYLLLSPGVPLGRPVASLNLQGGICTLSKKGIHGNELVPMLNSYWRCAGAGRKGAWMIQPPKKTWGLSSLSVWFRKNRLHASFETKSVMI